jgi:4-hydroxybenzoate polyprenyltransferase
MHPGGPTLAHLTGLVRLVHPFPSVLNAAITCGLALVAGGSPATAARLAGAMLALQASIGSLNDLLDAPRDAGRKPRKPIPEGRVTARDAQVVAAAGLILGLALAAPSGLATLLVALAGAGAGYAYDLRLKSTPIGWVAFAVGIPLLPVFAWLGSTGTVPSSFALLVPLAALSGAALALANALADHERDLAAGTPTVVTWLGFGPAWTLHAALQGAVVVVAAATLLMAGRAPWAALAAGAVILTGVGLAAGGSAGRRETGWEVEAAGTGLLAVVWLAGLGTGPVSPA